MPIKASQNIIDRIKEFEGFSPTAYKDAKTGRMAIGYGDTEGDMSRAITEEEASARLIQRIARTETELSGAISRALTQNQQDALIDMHYNAGLGGMGKIIARVNNGIDDQTIANALALYNKSTDVATGEKYVIPALEDRANFRSALWIQKDEEGGVSRSPNGQFDMPDGTIANTDVLDGVEDVEKFVNQGLGVNEQINSQMGYDVLEGLPPEEPRLVPKDKKASLDIMAASMGPYATAEVLRGKEAKRISELTGKSYEEVYSDLYTYTDKEILARNAHALTTKYFPAVANWGQKEDSNYVLMRETGDYARKIEARTRALSPNDDSDFVKALKMNEKQLQAAGVWSAFALGKATIEDVKAAALSLDEDQRALALSPEIQKVQEEASQFDVSSGFKKVVDAIFPEKGIDLNWDAVVKAYDGSEEMLDAILDKAQVYFSNPGATAIMATQSLAGTVLPMGMALSGNPVAVAGAMAISAGMAMGERMQENLEAFRDPDTGLIDVDKAFSDPKRIEEWKNGLRTYATVMGAAEGALGLKWGKYFAKAVPKSVKSSAVAGVAKKAVNVASKIPGSEEVSSVVATSMKGAVEEGLGQLAASTSADVVEGKSLKKSIVKNIDSAVEEGIFGAFIGGGLSAGGLSIGTAAKVRAKYRLGKATKANVDAVNLAEMRATVNSEETLKDNKEEVKSLIEEVVNPSDAVKPEPSANGDIFESADKVSDTDVKYSDIYKQKATVEVSPSEWDEHHIAMGIDPAEAISKLGPETQAAYLANKMTDSSFAVPVSEWASYTKEELDPSVDMIVRQKGNDLNANEANAHIEQVQEDPFKEFNILPPEGNEETPPPVPSEVTEDEDEETPPIPRYTEPDSGIEPWSFVEYEKDGETKILPITLTTVGNTEAEQKIFSDMLAAMKFSLENAEKIDPQMLEMAAQFQLNHMKTRARLIDVSLEDLAKQLKFGKMTKKEEVKALGYYQAKRYFDDIAKIAFGTQSDPFTILHELGHSWLQEMGEDYQFIYNKPEESLRPDQLEYKRAMETMADLLGIDNVSVVVTELEEMYTLDRESQRYKYLKSRRTRFHETFAQTAERYFIDGKFKNSKLRAMLEQFKKWLKPFMKWAGKAYRDYVAPDNSYIGIPYLKITPAVERLFDIILGATEAAENAVVPMFPKPMFDPKMLGAEGPAYLEAHTAALGEAIGETYYAAINKMYREREKAINKHKNELYAEAEAKVDKLPAMNVLKFFETNPEAKLSLESVAEVLFEGDIEKAAEFRKTVPKSIIAAKKKGGADANQFMLQNEINDPNIMKQLFETAAKRDELIEEEFNKLVKEKYPVVKTDEEIHDIAVKKINSDGKEKLLAKEMKILATKKLAALKGMAVKAINPATYVGKDSMLAIKTKAALEVYKSSKESFNPHRYLRDSERHGRRAAEAFGDNDIMKAYDMKYLQTIDFHKYKKGLEIEKDVVKTDKIIGSLDSFKRVNETIAKKYDIGMLKYAKAVLEALRTNQAVPLLDSSYFYESSAVEESYIVATNTAVQAITKGMEGSTWANITVENYIVLGRLLTSLVKQSKNLRELQIGNQKKQAEEFALEAVEKMHGNNVVSYETSGPDSNSASVIRAYKTNVPSLFKGLYKTTENYLNSPIGKVITEIKKFEALRNNHFTKTDKAINEALQNCVKARKGDSNFKAITTPFLKRAYILTGKEWDAPIFAPELKLTFKNRQQLFMACLHMLGSESGKQKFLKGNTKVSDPRLVDVFINRMIEEGQLIKEDFDFFQMVWDANEEIYPEIERAFKAVDNREIGYIEPKAFKNKFGEYRGGYMRSQPSEKGNRKLNGNMGIKNSPHEVDIFNMFPSRQTGFSQERTEAVYALDLDLKNVTRYLSAAYNVAYLRVPSNNFSKLMKSEILSNEIERRRPGALENVVAPWVYRINDQIYTEYSKDFFNTKARFLRNNMNTVIYFANFKSAIKQYYGLAQTVSIIGVRPLITTMYQSFLAPKQTRAFIVERSPVMADRFERSIRDTARSIQELNANFDWIDWTSDKIKQYSFVMSQITQNHVDTMTWRAAYVKAIKENQSEAQAIAFADDTVESSQTSAAVSFMANIQAGTDTKKLFTQILSVPVGIANLASIDAQRDQTMAAKAAAISKLFLWTTSLPTLIALVLGEMFDAEDDDEDKEDTFLLDMATANALGAIDMIFPLASRPLSFGGSLGPTIGALKDTAEVIPALNKKRQGVDLTDNEFNMIMGSLTFWTGNALPIIFKTGNRLNSFMESEEEKDQEKQNRRYQLQELRYSKEYSKFD